MKNKIILWTFVFFFLVTTIYAVNIPTVPVWNPYSSQLDLVWWLNETSSEFYSDNGFLRLNTSTLGLDVNKSYVDTQDAAVNASARAYTLSEILFNNGTVIAYIDAQDIVYNSSMVVYVDSANDSMKLYIDGRFTTNNASLITYILGRILDNNNTVISYVNSRFTDNNVTLIALDTSTNISMKGYVDTEISKVNGTLNATYVTHDEQLSNNITVVAYIDSQDILYNESMVTYVIAQILDNNLSVLSYVDSQDEIYNTSMIDYTGSTFLNKTQEGDLNVNHSDSTTSWAGVTGFVTRWFADIANVFTFNETLLNSTIDNKIDTHNQTLNDTYVTHLEMEENNDTVVYYIDTENVIYNNSMVTYVTLKILDNNNSVVAYINSQDDIYNQSMVTYVNAANVSLKYYVDDRFTRNNLTLINLDTATNISMKAYVDARFISNNATLLSYILNEIDKNNDTMIAYTNAQILSNNNTVINYVDTRFDNNNLTLIALDTSTNTSMKLYVDSQDAAYDNDTLQSVTTRGNTTTNNITAGDFIIPAMKGNNDYESLNDAFNLFNSAGRISGGEIIDNGSTKVVVLAGEGISRIVDDDVSQVKFIGWDNSSPIEVVTDSIMYFGVDYNSGSPIVINTTTEDDFDLDTSFPLGSCINQKDVMYCLNNSWWVGDGLTNVIERFQAEDYLYRDKNVGGLILGVTGTRNPTMTEGVLWARLIEHPISAFDASGGDTFNTYYRDGAGGYNEYTGQTQYNVTLWDDDSGILQTIDNNKYVVLWVWVNVASQKISIMYPQAQYLTSATAEAEEIPSTFPAMWYKGGIIIGRIITQEGSDTPVEVQSAFTTTFTPSEASDHANLANLAYATSGHTGFMASTNNDSMKSYVLNEIDKNNNTLDATYATETEVDTKISNNNVTVLDYINTQDSAVNASARAYALAEILSNNATVEAYILAEILSNNGTVEAYVLSEIANNNATVENYILAEILSNNGTITFYIDTRFTNNNGTLTQYTLDAISNNNASLTDYTDDEILANNATIIALDTATNVSMKTYVDSQDTIYNTSMKSYVDTRFTNNNASLIAYIDTKDSDVNKTYVDDTFIAKASEGNLNVNESDYWDDLDTPADINAADITDDGTYSTPADVLSDIADNNATVEAYILAEILSNNNTLDSTYATDAQVLTAIGNNNDSLKQYSLDVVSDNNASLTAYTLAEILSNNGTITSYILAEILSNNNTLDATYATQTEALSYVSNNNDSLKDYTTDEILSNNNTVLTWANAQFYNSTEAATHTALTLTAPLTVANGGTGTQSFTDGSILFGAATGAIEPSAQFPAGTLVIGITEGTNPALVMAFTAHDGVLKHEFGGLEADVHDYSDGLYGMISGATADIDTQGELNSVLDAELVNKTYVDGLSGSDINKTYTDTQDAAVNASARAYTLAEILSNNATVEAYILAEILSNNGSIIAYIDSQDGVYNASMKVYVDAIDVSTNTSMKAYVDAQDVIYNTSMKTYTDAQDTVYNQTLGDLVTTAPITGAADNIFGGPDKDITIAMAQADTDTDGWLSSTDWDTFNEKGSGTVTSVTGAAPITSTEGTTPEIALTLLKDVVATAPVTVNGGTNVDDILPGANADLTFAVSTGAVTNGATTLSTGDQIYDYTVSNNATVLSWANAQFYNSTEAATFTTVDTGNGATEVYDMNQDIQSDDDVTFNKCTITTNMIVTGRIISG